MTGVERVTVSLAADLVREIDRVARNRSRFVAEAVERELARRRHEGLMRSLRSPHPETVAFADTEVAAWAADLPEDKGLVDTTEGTPVRWIRGRGWRKESR